MANFFVTKCIHLIKSNKPELTKTDLEIIQYGIHGLYLSLTKIVVLIIISIILGQLKEFFIFSMLFGILRTNSFGIHAKKSWMCWITTIPIFVLLPLLAQHLIIPVYIKAILGIILILHVYRYSPADTEKRPIISPKIRKKHKVLATIVATIYIITSFFIASQIVANSLLFSLILINIFISPFTYKLFNLPYNNYLKYVDKYGRKEKLC